MHTPQPKKDKNVVSGKLGRVGTGHRPHRGGGGQHAHKCDRRQGNRTQQTNRAIGEW